MLENSFRSVYKEETAKEYALTAREKLLIAKIAINDQSYAMAIYMITESIVRLKVIDGNVIGINSDALSPLLHYLQKNLKILEGIYITRRNYLPKDIKYMIETIDAILHII